MVEEIVHVRILMYTMSKFMSVNGKIASGACSLSHFGEKLEIGI